VMKALAVILLLAAQLPAQNPIQHIVFIVKENHSFDNVFGTFAGANGATTGLCGSTKVPLTHSALGPPNLPHDWNPARTSIDNGKMDGFCQITPNYGSYIQYYQSDIPNYWTYAQQFVLADNFFSSLTGASFGNHLYLTAATSNEFVTDPKFPNGPDDTDWGCDAPADATAARIPNPHKSQTFVWTFPCMEATTLSDLLDGAGLSWHYYAPAEGQPGYIWSIFDSVPHIRYGKEWTTNISLPQDFLVDLTQKDTLANFTWIAPEWGFSEHPKANICDGENWSVAQVNAIMQSKFWESTVIFIAWDDWGGYYDHVPPPSVDYFGLGIRVPMIIISPWVRAKTVIHTQYEFASVLKFAEETFKLAQLTKRDKKANDMMDAFDFNQTSLSPLLLKPHKCSEESAAPSQEDLDDPD
jgi:phospholipase C